MDRENQLEKQSNTSRYKLQPDKIRQILVVRALPGIGDMLCCIPALRSLRHRFPTARVKLIGLPQMRWFATRFPSLINDWSDFPGFPGIPEGWQGAAPIPQFLTKIQQQQYDLTLQMHGSGDYINPFALLLGAKTTAGFYRPGEFCPDEEHFLPYPNFGTETARLLALLSFLGIPTVSDRPDFPISFSERKQQQQLLQQNNLLPHQYICIHAGASTPQRQWSTSGFAKVAAQLAARGYPLILTGTLAERPLVEVLEQQIHHLQPKAQTVNLAGKTNIGTAAALLEQAALTICNDTGISHLAIALQAPSIVIFSNSEIARWAASDRTLHQVIDARIAASEERIADTIIRAATDRLPAPPIKEEPAYA